MIIERKAYIVPGGTSPDIPPVPIGPGGGVGETFSQIEQRLDCLLCLGRQVLLGDPGRDRRRIVHSTAYTVYDYRDSRSWDGPAEFLTDFRSYLQTDVEE